MSGVSGGGHRGSTPPVPRPISDTQKDRAERTGQQDKKGPPGPSHDHRMTDAFREKMEKFCESVEALKRGETGGRQTNTK